MGKATKLERVSVGRPCPRRWAELVGDEKRRYCSSCALHVTNLSALGAREAEAFLAASSGRVCVTYVPAARGGAASRRELAVRGLGRGLARAAALLFGLVFLLPGCRPSPAQAPAATGPEGDPPHSDPDGTRRLGRLRPEPECRVEDDQLMVMGEMLVESELPVDADGDAGAAPK